VGHLGWEYESSSCGAGCLLLWLWGGVNVCGVGTLLSKVVSVSGSCWMQSVSSSWSMHIGGRVIVVVWLSDWGLGQSLSLSSLVH